jgi:ABC-type nitrate/sulfonate/bicarbonate transport system substrate-binding protein
MKKLFLFSLLVFALGLAGDLLAQQRIAVSYPGIAGYNIPFWVALDGGEFKKAGLEVDPVLISGGSKSMQALLSGGLDFAHVSGGVSVQANLSGAEVAIIATAANSMSAGVIAAKEIKTYDYFARSISDTLRTEREGITEFLATLEPKTPGASKRNPNEFIDESVLEEVLKAR